MYTSEPFQKTLRANAPSANASATKLSPLPPQGHRGLAPPPPLPPSPPGEMLPHPFRSPNPPYPAELPSFPSQMGRSQQILMDPLAALRRCLQYVCSHPEVYGDDVRSVLDREVMHVVRLKASEVSLVTGQRPLLMDPLESGSARRNGAAAAPVTGTRTSPGVSALPTIAASSAHQQQQHNSGGGNGPPGAVPAGDLFGYGSVSFLPASTAGFGGLQLEARAAWGRTGDEDIDAEVDTFFPGSARQGAPLGPLGETIQWGGTLPPTSTHGSGGLSIRSIAREAVRDDEGAAAAGAEAGTAGPESVEGRGRTVLGRKSYFGSPAMSPKFTTSDGPPRSAPHPQSLMLLNSGDVASSPVAAVPNALCAADGTVMVVDQQGYEVTYLRTQLQQLEAAFNAKCVRLHELEVENRQFADKMKAAEEATARWSAQNHAMQGQLEAMRRELDGWKDRANDAVAAATKQSKQRSQHAKQIASTQLLDARHEISRLGQLWRETERALQETRRAFDNTEKEATAAHNHLADAFHYLERLERRVARRDAYLDLCERRQRSLEEKYDKLRWGFEELSALEGRYSYVDYMLTTKPLWTVYMFLCLARHLGDYVALENRVEVQQRLMRMVEQAAGETDARVDAIAAAAAALEPLYALLVSRTPNGGRLVALHYDLRLVFCTMRDEVTAALNRRGRPKQLRTTLHGSVACRAIRWHERYSIDYLRGVESDPDSGELNRKFVPVLSLASLLLPLRSRAGALLVQPAVAEQDETAAAEPEVAAAQAKAEEDRVSWMLSTVPNKRHYDQATIRFVLRCFWKERLGVFTAQMKARIKTVTAKMASSPEMPSSPSGSKAAAAEKARNLSETSATLAEADGASDNLVEDVDDDVLVQTFLSALVDFATRFTAEQGGGGGSSGGGSGNATGATAPAILVGGPIKASDMPNREMLLSVRGVLAGGAAVGKPAIRVVPGDASKGPIESVWDSGRVFFATVLRPVPAPVHPDNHRNESHGSFRKLPVEEEEVKTLAEDARELLSALYYYTLEYKDQDPDFRLFYLVSHQMIPEMVAVNFFAGIEAVQQEAVAMVETRLQCLPSGCYNATTFVGGAHEAASSVSGTASSSQTGAFAAMPTDVDDPLTALTRAVDIMDEALLDGEDVDVEPDSDGEGYGTILPFDAAAETRTHRRASASPASTPQPSPVGRREAEGEAGSAEAVPVPLRARELRLLHNIRAYLRARRASMQGTGGSSRDSVSVDARASVSKAAEPSNVVSEEEHAYDEMGSPTSAQLATFGFGDAPPEWTALEQALLHCLGPHTALLEVFREQYRKRLNTVDNAAAASSVRSKASFFGVSSPASPAPAAASSVGKEFGYMRRRRADRKRRHETTKYLSATRGLVSEEDTMALVQRHCLATYAVSCCGTPRFSLLRPLLRRRASRPEEEADDDDMPAGPAQLDPYTVVGHVPLTGLHLQRLRFALSLDQPSHLVRPSSLFAVDSITKTNSHFYDAYLTIVLDTFEQQQSFLMQSVLRSCAARHERYAAEGAEDCDGQVPIARLKNGLASALSAVRGTAQHAQALVNHFVQYDDLLRLEDEVKLEQFADAPLLLNVPPMEGRSIGFGVDAEGSVSQSSASRHRSIADSFAEEFDRGNFNLHEEADGCSLLHIAFAVRMTYIVWGPVSKPTAEALVNSVVRHDVPTCCCDDAAPDAVKAPGPLAPPSTKPRVQQDATVVTEQPEWDVFDQATRRAYTQTLRRLEAGHNGEANPLRRMLSILELEQPPSPADLGRRATHGTLAPRTTDDIDPSTLYPDVANVWVSKKVLAAGEARLEAIAAAAAAAATAAGAGGAGGAKAAGKGKKKSRVSQPGRSLSAPATASVAGDGTASEADTVAEAAQLPDYGMLSLARSLGFAPPVPAGGPFPAPSTQAVGKKGGGGAAAKKGGKKGAAAAKGGAPTDAAVAPAVQEAYGGALALQLQDLASRVAALVPLEPVYYSANASMEPSEAGAVRTPGRKSMANASVVNHSIAAPPGVSKGRARSAAFINLSRRSSAQAKPRKTVTVETPGEARANLEAGLEVQAPTWVPVFPRRPVAFDEVAPPPPSGVVVDVSVLYPICAALTMT